MSQDDRVAVRMFGMLDALRRERGLPCETEVEVPAGGTTGRDIAIGLDLPLERIEGVFCNHVVHGLGHPIHPGDRIAFVPVGTPGPHRYFLGLYAAGQEEDEDT